MGRTRSTFLALVALLLSPMAAYPDPILPPLDPNSWERWVNEYGTFLIDRSATSGGSGGATYSSYADNLFRHTSPSWCAREGSGDYIFFCEYSTAVLIEAVIEDNGTPGGNLVSGSLLITAEEDIGSDIKAGDILLAGHAIDSYSSSALNFSNVFLFRITDAHPLLSGFGNYVTFEDPQSCFFAQSLSECDDPALYDAWGSDVQRTVSWTTSQFWTTHRVPEPGTLALLGAGLIGMGFARRRKKA